MKFPLRERPFSRIALSMEQCDAYESLLQTVVDATVAEHDSFVHVDKRVLPKKQWKAVKHRDDISVYKRLGRDVYASTTAPPTPAQPAESCHWRMPKMIAVGTIAGSLDDIMYGIVTPDAPSIAVKTSYVNDELVDSAVLHTIHSATHEDPFRFTGLKWMVKAHTPSLNAVVWPRDFVFVEATGVRTLGDGTRMGFHAMHSVEHALCPELASRGIVRSQFSSCCVYFPRDAGTVEVYMVTFIEPGGSAPEPIAVMTAANTMIGIWKAVWCAQNKMLSWLLQNDAARRRFRAASAHTTSAGSSVSLQNPHCCQMCTKTFYSFRTIKGCQLCAAWVCSKCRIARKISTATDALVLSHRVVEVCTSCIAHVAVADAFATARDQYVLHAVSEQENTVLRDATRSKSLNDGQHQCHGQGQGQHQKECSTRSNSTRRTSLVLLSLGDFSDMPSRSREFSETESVVMETIEVWEKQQRKSGASSRPTASSYQSSMASDGDDDELPVLSHQQRLLLTIQSLCHKAEQTYQLTSLTASRVVDANGSTTARNQ